MNHKIKKGRLISEIDIFLNDKGLLENFIAKGLVQNLKVELMNDVNFKNINLGFFADKKDILIKNLAGDLEDIKITDGDIRFYLDDGIKLNLISIQNLILTKNIFRNILKYLTNLNFKKYKNL